MTSVVTLPTAPSLEIGPLSLAWHGIFTALGIISATALALRFARERDLDGGRVVNLVVAICVAGIIGARVFYLIEHDPGAFVAPGRWLGSTGFSFYGAVIFAVPTALFLYRDELTLTYLDVAASGFGLGMAVGRIGDILIGEHLGGPSELPWALRYSNPDALAPSTGIAYQPGPLYESVLGLFIFAVVWPRRARFQRPGTLVLAVLVLYAVGRFAMFFLRDDSDALAFGLSNAQVTSIGIALACLLAYLWLRRAAPSSTSKAPEKEEEQQQVPHRGIRSAESDQQGEGFTMDLNGNTNHHELNVSGMSCGSCAAHVQEALEEVAGVQTASVDLESGRATVEGDSIDTNQLVEAIARAGYGVRSAA